MSRKRGRETALVSKRRRASANESDDDIDDVNGVGSDDDDFDPLELIAVEEMLSKKRKEKQKRNGGAEHHDEDKRDADVEEGNDNVDNDNEDDNDDNNDDDADDDDDNATGQPKRAPINNIDALTSAYNDIRLPIDWPWVESFSLTTAHSLADVDASDDLAREQAFYKETVAAAKVGIINLKAANIPYIRPDDFYAEMFKTDTQMTRVKDALLTEQRRMSAVESRKKLVEIKKYTKKVAANKQTDKVNAKLAHAQQVKTLRQSSRASSANERSTLPLVDATIQSAIKKTDGKRKRQQRDDDADDDRDDNRRGGQNGFKKQKPSFARAAKDAKYGFGGKKKYVKSNDRESSNDASDFSASRNKRLDGFVPSGRGGRGGGRGHRGGRGGSRGGRGGSGGGRGGRDSGGGRGGAAQRPGKARRAQMRGK